MKNNDGLVSVIIPVYNRETVIEECINSVLSQSYQDFEIIIVDDGSTDNTVKICKQIEEKDTRIKFHCSEHGGVCVARNTAIEKSTGEFLFFLDSDDVIHPSLLAALVNGMNGSDALIAGSGIVNVNEKYWYKVAEAINNDNSEAITTYQNNYDTLNAIFHSITPLNLIGGVMIKRELIGDTRFNTELFIGEDFYFIYENLIKETSSIFLKQKWYYCRIHQNNSSNNFTFEAFLSRFKRRVLIWKNEEKLGRTKFANRQKNDATGIFYRSISENQYKGNTVKQICNVVKKYKNQILPALKFNNKIIFLISLYLPIAYAFYSKAIKILKKN